jgi:hypothetical protein
MITWLVLGKTDGVIVSLVSQEHSSEVYKYLETDGGHFEHYL